MSPVNPLMCVWMPEIVRVRPFLLANKRATCGALKHINSALLIVPRYNVDRAEVRSVDALEAPWLQLGSLLTHPGESFCRLLKWGEN